MQRTFSHSSLETYERCPRKYRFRYVDRVPVETESVEAFLGQRVHEVLERLYRFVAEGLVPSLARVVERFHANWEARFDAERVRIVREGLDADFYRASGVRCLENYYRRHYPFDADETLGLERRIQFPLDAEGAYPIRGVIDRLARAPDGALEIHDFKTSQRVPPQSVLDASRQLALYELGVREKLGERGPVRLVWHYVLPDQVRRSHRSPEALERLREETARTIDRIRDERDWEPRPGPLCDWCEFRSLCPAQAPAEAGRAAAGAAPEEPPHPAEAPEALGLPPREPGPAPARPERPAPASGDAAPGGRARSGGTMPLV